MREFWIGAYGTLDFWADYDEWAEWQDAYSLAFGIGLVGTVG